MSLARILVTTRVVMSHTFVVDKQPTDAGGAVTATVKRLDGSPVDAGTATHGTVGSGTYSWPVVSPLLDELSLDWSGSVGGATVTVRDIVEVVGGFFFGLDEATDELSLDDTAWPAAKLATKRIQVEQEAERICRQAFVPRFAREVLSGNGRRRIGVKWPTIRAVRAVTVNGVAWTAGQVAELGFNDAGTITRPVGLVWPAGLRNVVFEYEHGMDAPPQEIRDGSMLRLLSILPRAKSGVPSRATSWTDPMGATFRMSMPGPDKTGIPEVDGAYAKWPGPRRIVFA